MVGHRSGSCPSLASSPLHSEAQRSDSAPADWAFAEQSMQTDVVGTEDQPISDPLHIPPDCSEKPSVPAESFGPWMVVQHRRGRGAGKISHSLPTSRPVPPSADTWPSNALHARHVEAPNHIPSTRGRGGSIAFHISSVVEVVVAGVAKDFLIFFADPFGVPDRYDPSDEFQNPYPEVIPGHVPQSPIPSINSSGALGLGVSSKVVECLRSNAPSSYLRCIPQNVSSFSPTLFPNPPHLGSSPPLLEPSSIKLPPGSPPLLLSSLSLLSPLPSLNPNPGSDEHLALVSKVASALRPSPDPSQMSDGSQHERLEKDLSSETSADSDMVMMLDPHPKAPKQEATSRKDLSKAGSSRKKGRKILPY